MPDSVRVYSGGRPHWWQPGCDGYWRGKKWYQCQGGKGWIAVSQHDHPFQEADWLVFMPAGIDYWLEQQRGEFMASKWIAQAKSHVAEQDERSRAEDQYLFKGRPALTDFLTIYAEGEGVYRELSCLMITVTPEGFRLGLKDEAAGGWCWREGKTVSKALDSIEEALQGATNPFRQAGGGQKKKK